MPIYALGDIEPQIDSTAYVHPEAVIIGAVQIGSESSVWPHAVVRADDNQIIVGSRTSVQDNAVLHCTSDLPTIVGNDVTLGHLCHLEGCTIEDEALIGVGSAVLHEAVVGVGSIVGANAIVRNRQIVPQYSMALGVPATVREGVVPEGENISGALAYVQRISRFRQDLRRID